MKKTGILELFIDHFNESGWPSYVNENKLHERSSVSEDTARPGWYILEIERHRRVLGANYIKGQPMNAYQTYWMRYAVHQESGKVEDLPEISGEVSIEDIVGLVDEGMEGMVDLSIEPIDSGKYRITESVDNHELIISNLEEAQAFGEKMAIMLTDDYLSSIQEDNDISEDELTKLSPVIEKEIRSWIVAKIDELWEEIEMEEDEDDE